MCVSHGRDIVECEKCAWKSRPYPEGLSWSDDLQESARRRMPCFYCKDTKKTTVMNKMKRQAQDRDLCRCSEDTETEVYDNHPRYPGKLVTVCETCRCVVSYVD